MEIEVAEINGTLNQGAETTLYRNERSKKIKANF